MRKFPKKENQKENCFEKKKSKIKKISKVKIFQKLKVCNQKMSENIFIAIKLLRMRNSLEYK